MKNCIRVFVTLSSIAFCIVAHAASFDCAKAKSAQDKLICMDYRLSDLDDQLAELYGIALKQTSNAAELKRDQANWLGDRLKCDKFSCVMATYIKRIRHLAPETKLIHNLDLAGDLPWDRVPPEGSKFSRGVLVEGQSSVAFQMRPKWPPASEQLLNFSSGKPFVLPVVPSKHIRRDFLERMPLSVPLGNRWLSKSSMQYGECGQLMLSGVWILPRPQNEKDQEDENNSRRLLFLKPSPYVIYKANADCAETELRVEPLSILDSVIHDSSLYFLDQDFVVRFDSSLDSGSRLIGQRLQVSWAKDIKQLLGSECDRKFQSGKLTTVQRYQCIDERLYQLIRIVRPYYIQEDSK